MSVDTCLQRVILLAALATAVACDSAGTTSSADADDLIRERAAALFVEEKVAEAAEVLAPLHARADARIEDLESGAIVLAALDRGDEGWQLIERAHARAPDDTSVVFTRGNYQLTERLDPEAAALSFAQVVAADPNDASARLQLAQALSDTGDLPGAREQLEAVRAIGLPFTGSLHLTATYQLGQLLVRSGEVDAGRELLAEKTRLEDQGFRAATATDIERGVLPSPPPVAIEPGPPSASAFPAFEVAVTIDLPHREHVIAADFDGNGHVDLLGYGADEVSFALQDAVGSFSTLPSQRNGMDAAAAADFDNDGLLELASVSGGRLAFAKFVPDSRSFTQWQIVAPALTGLTSATPVDFDHDGDLDLALASVRGLVLLRNDGEGTFADATPEGADAFGACTAIVAEDIDGDNDVDLLVGRVGALTLLSNERSERFTDVSTAWNVPATAGTLAVADLDADGRSDLIVETSGRLAWHRFDGTRFSAGETLGGAPAAWALHDLDLDGHLDLLGRGDDGGLWASPGPLVHRSTPPARTGVAGLLQGDLSAVDVLGAGAPAGAVDPRPIGDAALELIQRTDNGVTILAPAAGARRGVSLDLQGVKDNRQGVGAIVEVRSGGNYERIFWRGERRVLGVPGGTADIIRVTWPNGVVQHAFDVPAGTGIRIIQVDRLGGSCPFLYTWNGETFTFITDVLGATPLGLPMLPAGVTAADAPPLFVPFDHEEYVKIRAEQLVPDEQGLLRLALTEELREVTYLDRARLHAIDHPAGTEIQPDESFTFPPFPPHHVHALTNALPPASATAGNTGDGSELAELLAVADERVAQPFTPLAPQFQGLCEPWSLEVQFGRDDAERAAIIAAPRLRLALTGWLQWGDASVNVSAARDPGAAFEPPVLSVPDGMGWRATGPPIGFPAGKTKTMIVDVTELLDRDDPRIRLDTTLELSWDAIRLVIDDDDAPRVDTALEAVGAELAYRGFSRLIPSDGSHPERFVWDEPNESLHWTQHPGMYTRYGDVVPLLTAVDDRYVIFGAGDTLELSFDAAALPPLPDGWTRDWLLFVDGWAKDGDPNTWAAQSVEPLPFHGMSAYPPPPGEAAPDTPEHRAWRKQWNTRPARRLIEPLHAMR